MSLSVSQASENESPSIPEVPSAMMITKRRMVALYVVLALLVGVILGQINMPVYWRLLNHGEATRATVVRTHCQNHGMVEYRFTTGGHEYTRSSNAGFGTLACGEFKAGDQILVYSLPSDPDVSRAGSIRERWVNEVISILLAVALLPTIVVLSLWRRLPARYRVTSSTT